MGRLPTEYFDDIDRTRYKIRYRYDYTMPGELVVAVNTAGNVFAAGTFLHNNDMPFEIHKMLCTVVGLDSSNNPIASLATPDKIWLLDNLTRIQITDQARGGLLITKNQQLVATLLERNTRTWNWAEPYYLKYSQELQVTVNNTATSGSATGGVAPGVSYLTGATGTLANLRVNITFEGYRLALGEQIA